MASTLVHLVALAATAASALSIQQLNGPKFLTPYNGQTVANISGVVTAKGPDGIWLRDASSSPDGTASTSIYVFGRAFGANLTVGDGIVLGGRVTEYRSNKDYLYLTQLDRPILSAKVSSGNIVKPLIIGQDTLPPPTEEYSSLDNGDVFAVPNNMSLVSTANPSLQPRKYGLDFWEHLTGELVTIRDPTALTKPNTFGDTWVAGNWNASGQNARKGLTMTTKDANPEAILIGSPLDGTKNPTDTKMGDHLADITGVLTYAFGFYRILPTTAVRVNSSSQIRKFPAPTTLESKGSCEGVTVGAYNVENLAANSTHHGALAEHVVRYLKSPDVVFVQEVQDDNGPTNDGVVSANQTLSTLTSAIRAAGGPQYAFADIAPVDDQDGGQPGGNIRTAYLYNPALVQLYKPHPGGPLDANDVGDGPALKYNPGRIDPANGAWTASRKPLVAQWEAIGGASEDGQAHVFFTVNGGVQDRIDQSVLTAEFVKEIFSKDKNARIITAGDFNEFTFVEPLKQYVEMSGLKDADAAGKIDELERYTYLFDMNAQQLDHMFVSDSLATKIEYEHVHVNTWPEFSAQVSDHDPSVARVNVCA